MFTVKVDLQSIILSLYLNFHIIQAFYIRDSLIEHPVLGNTSPSHSFKSILSDFNDFKQKKYWTPNRSDAARQGVPCKADCQIKGMVFDSNYLTQGFRKLYRSPNSLNICMKDKLIQNSYLIQNKYVLQAFMHFHLFSNSLRKINFKSGH